MTGSRSIIPLDYDVEFVIKKANLTNNYGWEIREDGIHVVYSIDSYDAMRDTIDNYHTYYTEVMRPDVLLAIDNERKERARSFDFMGMMVALDTTTVANMTAAVAGLERDPNRLFINWQVSIGKFVTIPREMMYALADASFNYFQGCFDRSRALMQMAQDATTTTELAAIDVKSGWPAGVPAPTPPVPPEEPEEPEAPGEGEGEGTPPEEDTGNTEEPEAEPTPEEPTPEEPTEEPEPEPTP